MKNAAALSLSLYLSLAISLSLSYRHVHTKNQHMYALSQYFLSYDISMGSSKLVSGTSDNAREEAGWLPTLNFI